MSGTMIENLPETFRKNMLAMPHFDGAEWIKKLPELIAKIEKKWSIRVGKHYPNLTFNYVASCKRKDGSEAVLKIAFPENKTEIIDEGRVLKFFNGDGLVRLYLIDEELEFLILEKVEPGRSLKEVFANKKELAVPVAINLLKKIHRPEAKTDNFPHLNKWFDDFDNKCKRFNVVKFERASKMLIELNSDKKKWTLLHGDFHHDNILESNRDGFLAIDPSGIVGNVGYEIAVYLNNHAAWLGGDSSIAGKLSEILRLFSNAFDISERELTKWAYAQQVLSAWWYFEDGGNDWEEKLEIAEIWVTK
jgi:streptomycin 6-kinase